MKQTELDSIKIERAAILEKKGILLAQNSLLKFTEYTKPDYETNWHHRVICGYLDAFVSGRIRRLMIFIPPRHGKSELVSRRLPAYALGKNPNEDIVLASYAAALASAMCVDVQNIMDGGKYLSVFPDSYLLRRGMEFKGRVPKKSLEYFEMAHADYNGSMKSVGVGGGLTGFGFSMGIIDDPFKNREEADSELIRESVWKWYTSTFLTRQNTRDARICIIMHRWHEDDLAGRLLDLAKKNPDADQWHILDLPALLEGEPRNKNDKRKPGEPLWSKYGVKFLQRAKAADSRDWSSLYQQSPYTEGGTILKRHWWKFYLPPGYDKPPGKTEEECPQIPRYFDETVLSADCAFKDFKTSDFVAIQIWIRRGADKYLIDQVKDKMDFVETCDAITNLCGKYPNIRHKWIEDKANGSAVISAMKRRVSGLIAVNPEGGKVARARAISSQIESGNVYLPLPECCPWVYDFIDECSKFPLAKNDDQVDACTQALTKLEEHEGTDLRKLVVF
jgi:predicted phage terminase large subunit-like protein